MQRNIEWYGTVDENVEGLEQSIRDANAETGERAKALHYENAARYAKNLSTIYKREYWTNKKA